MRTFILLVGLCCHAAVAWAQTYLSPKQVGGGNIPAGYKSLVFSLSDGNWAPTLTLPAAGADGATIQIKVGSTWASTVLQGNTDVPLPSVTLATGQSVQYRYALVKKLWEVQAPTVYGPNNGSALQVTMGSSWIARAVLANGFWAPSVVLPATAPANAVVLVSSAAQWASAIDGQNLLFDYKAPLRMGQAPYAFVFNVTLAKWVLVKSPETLLLPQDLIGGSAIPPPATPVARLSLPLGTAALKLHLPASANDRNRLVLQSQSTNRSSIAGGASWGTLTIGQGESYEFMWDASLPKPGWVLLNAPTTLLKAGALNPQGYIPPVQTPKTTVQAWDGNWAPQLYLPDTAQSNDRVTVKSSATWNMRVTGRGLPVQLLSTGEEVVFVYDSSKGWARETNTVRLMLASSQAAVTRLGLAAAQARQLESLRLSNEALANSGSKFRYQLVSLFTAPTLGTDLGTAVNLMRSNKQIQDQRKLVAADAVYYEGTEDGCGLAWVNSVPNKFNMAASGSLNCGTTVMRHELGHNMGLGHGNGLAPTVMSGNALAYFATPNRYDSRSLLPLSYRASVANEVSVMDANAPVVAKFHLTP